MNYFKSTLTIFSLVLIIFFWQSLEKYFSIDENITKIEEVSCLSYAPYNKNESPFLFDKGMILKEENIKNDLILLQKYTSCIRTYSTVGQELVFKVANDLNMKIHAGIWIGKEEKQAKAEINTLKELKNLYPNTIKSIIVGNEVLLRKDATKEQLISYLKEVKNLFPEYKVTYADVWEFWLKNKELKDYVDFITIHILPYWEDEPKNIKDAIEHVKNVRLHAEDELNSSNILIGETGWPSNGRVREEAFASRVNQAEYIRGFIQLANSYSWDYNIIEAIDQAWKRSNEGAVGGYWGVFDEDRKDKNVFNSYVSDFPNYLSLTFLNLILFFYIMYKFVSKESSLKNYIKITIFNLICSILIVFQIDQYFHTVRNFYEFLWALILIALALYSYIFIIYNKSLDNNYKILPKITFYLFLSILFIISSKLAFNGRYENFEIFVLYILLISFIYNYSNKLDRLKLASFDKIVSLFLLFNTIFIFYNEGIKNIFSQSIILINLSLLVFLFFASKVKLKDLIKPLLYLFSFMFIALLFKYFVLYNESLGFYCQNNSENLLCNSVGYIWYMLYFNYLGVFSLTLALLYYLFSYKFILIIALFVTLISLTLTNIFLASIAFLIIIYRFSSKYNELRK
ncbi:glycosyl hydrolase [Aliarcobacter thereius]|uniref:Endo-1,3-beta-glucanase btgC n=1 Tax=Aliarcobacter thereius TaxID=544718 RepID=A0A5R9GWU2_9BACT|nr:glycosyl hydrolase [Aliarcobacter thereius]TLS71117.1 glycosyl hydrolase [Aliarcobacter thereius]